MKNRNIEHKDDWATPTQWLKENIGEFDFDPCPWKHDLTLWDGLEIDWSRHGDVIFINPPYSQKLKELFVVKAYIESQKGIKCKMLLPVSTSTNLFHSVIKPNAKSIEFVKGRIPFIGINTKGEYVNWHLWDRQAPEGVTHVKNSGQHDSMIVTFYERKLV